MKISSIFVAFFSKNFTSFEKNDFLSAKLDMFRIMIINILYLETKFEIIYITAGPSDRENYLNFL